MNNLKQIREIYGATQEEIAAAIGVNRVTVANWENGSSIASSANQEKLSIYYGIGPEFFYQQELNNSVKRMIHESAVKAHAAFVRSKGTHSKAKDFRRMFDEMTFSEAMSQYMFAMKMLLATADTADLRQLETAQLINEKMGMRLSAMLELRRQEQQAGVQSLFDLIENLENSE